MFVDGHLLFSSEELLGLPAKGGQWGLASLKALCLPVCVHVGENT